MTRFYGWFWESFEPMELLSPVGFNEYVVRGNFMLQPFAVSMLQQFRTDLNVPLVCNGNANKYRGFRSPQENEKIGGARLSRHIQGIAFDLTPRGMELEDFFKAAVQFGFGGVGYYPHKNFVHVDCRPIGKFGQAVWDEAN